MRRAFHDHVRCTTRIVWRTQHLADCRTERLQRVILKVAHRLAECFSCLFRIGEARHRLRPFEFRRTPQDFLDRHHARHCILKPKRLHKLTLTVSARCHDAGTVQRARRLDHFEAGRIHQLCGARPVVHEHGLACAQSGAAEHRFR